MSVWEGMGAGATGGAVGGILDLAFGGMKNKRNEKTANRQRDKDEESQKRMADYHYDLGMKQWEATGYKAQVEQMKRAGLNPALMYGTAGSGGTTATQGGGASQSVNSEGSNGVGMGMQMGLQSAMMEAQINNINADTKNKEADVQNKGADTILKGTQAQSLVEGINNIKAETRLKGVQEDLISLQHLTNLTTFDAQIRKIEQEGRLIFYQAENAMHYADINEATKNEKISIIKTELIGAMLSNAYTRAGINKTEAEINKMAKDIEVNFMNASTNKMNANTNNRNTWQSETKILWDKEMQNKSQDLKESEHNWKMFMDGVNTVMELK